MTNLLLFGCGNMGGALLACWSESLAKHIAEIYVVDPHAMLPDTAKKISHAKQLEGVPENFSPSVVVLAVKPQQLDSLLGEVAKKFGTKPLYLSIAAGKSLAFYEKHLGEGAQIVRAMPNTPAMVGEGMTGLIGNASLSESGKNLATELLSAVGDTLWLDDESLMDALTAISGSGPAYFYYMVECLTEAGIKAGLSAGQAQTLAVQTFSGASKLLKSGSKTPAELRAQVTSKGGTTEAALKAMKEQGLPQVIEAGVQAAIKRAKEL